MNTIATDSRIKFCGKCYKTAETTSGTFLKKENRKATRPVYQCSVCGNEATIAAMP
jgi:hypothetical protein